MQNRANSQRDRVLNRYQARESQIRTQTENRVNHWRNAFRSFGW